MEATILHADLDAFYASVEQRDDPLLRARPVIVGAGVVLAASYEAKVFGVRTAMTLGRARQLCPRAVVVSPRMSAYADASKAAYAVFADTSPSVEGLSIDEAFLDTSGMRRADEVPREGRERRREAGRPAPRSARARARLPPPTPGGKPVGCRRGHRGEAPESRDPHRRRGRRFRGGRARGDAWARSGPALARARPQPGSAAGAAGPSAALDRLAARTRRVAEVG